ncbi:MAG TPA: EsaB/YukD family protein, partial [Rugosimonospora sp.]|nr:EsaB/YukD family protein [Rugosimonospora sp.]
MVTPRARIDLSLPAHSPVAELLPQLVRIAGHTGSAGVA